jgi:hypothetical protein
MKISIQQNTVRPGTYRVVLHTGTRATFEDFIRHVEGGSTITRADAVAVLTAAAEWVRSRAARGREADLGPLGRSRLGMRGTFESIPERVEDADVTLTVGWVLPGPLKRAVARAGRELVRERVAPAPKTPHPVEARRTLPDGVPDPQPGRYQPGQALCVRGARLDYDATRPDEGVFLLDASGSATRVSQVFTNEPKQVAFLMPPDAAGPYTLELRRRHPRGHGTLLSGRLSEAIVPV